MKKEKNTFKFIDLFAGIGGFHLAIHNLGGECVFASEWDKYARITYEENFKTISTEIFKNGKYNWDINDIEPPEIDNFNVLCAEFPCQPFSIAGKREGFNYTRGTLFFNIEEIISVKRPKVVFIENVKNLASHDKGKTFETIIQILEDKLGYNAYSKVLNSATHANIPQNRERIFIIAFDPNQVKNHSDFKFPNTKPIKKNIHDVLENEKQPDNLYNKEDHQYYTELKRNMISKDTIYQWRRVYVRENKSNLCPTLTANMGTSGHIVPLVLDDYGVRKLSPRECFYFQGFPKKFKLTKNMANSHLYKQDGNSVVVSLIEEVGKEIIKIIN
jgi:DNA (cytosine-5)-methyltransferase 1